MTEQPEWKNKPCTACGEPVTWRADKFFSAGKRQIELGECNECAHWTIVCDHPPQVVIEGHAYGIGDEKPGTPSSMRGFAGRRFDIEFFDGRKVTSHNLWSQGPIPERFRDRLKDNAAFGGGARKVQVGDTTCWEASAS